MSATYRVAPPQIVAHLEKEPCFSLLCREFWFLNFILPIGLWSTHILSSLSWPEWGLFLKQISTSSFPPCSSPSLPPHLSPRQFQCLSWPQSPALFFSVLSRWHLFNSIPTQRLISSWSRVSNSTVNHLSLIWSTNKQFLKVNDFFFHIIIDFTELREILKIIYISTYLNFMCTQTICLGWDMGSSCQNAGSDSVGLTGTWDSVFLTSSWVISVHWSGEPRFE